MSDEERKEEEVEVEGHIEERSADNEPAEEDDNDFDAHLMRMD